MTDFVHLHVHTEYSLLDGACKLAPLINRAKDLGQKSLAITDHGVMYGVVDFYKLAKAAGIKPIIGCEVYVAPRSRFDQQPRVDNSPYHLVLLCKNNQGYQNLIKLVSQAFIEGFYYKPRIDREILEKHSEGLIALSACLAGEVPRALTAGDYNRAKEAALYYKGIFKEDYYIEIQDHGIPEQIEILPQLARIAREIDAGLVATNDLHYIEKKDSVMQNVLVCIQTGTTVEEGSGMEFSTNEFYLKSGDEMSELFKQYPTAIENSLKIADKCEIEFVFGQTKLPQFTSPDERDNLQYFRDRCYQGLYKHYGESPSQEVIERLEYELGIITSMGYVDYYLIVHDFIDHAKSKGIPVGPGRGSGAGSLAAYCIGITGIDPIEYNLLFERFLNPERISMPDFDIDFCYERRQEVIDYVVEKYGDDHVAQIITFGTMAARGAIRDVGRALGMSYQSVDVIAKAVPFELGMTIEKALAASPELKGQYELSTQNKQLIDMAKKVEGMARNASTHAAGVVITRDPVDAYVPLQKNDASIVTQFPMNTLEELGLLKMDFLGLRNLTVISDAQNMIRRQTPDFDIEKIPLNDPGVFELLSKGQTVGVFQFESPGMKNVLTSLKPEYMEDLIAVISLYRPGPMDSIPRYVKNRHNPSLVTYKHPLLIPILKVTYGCIVYQEQVMQICREMAGYSYGRADLVRRAMSKKKADVMEKERSFFVEGAEKNGVSTKVANEIFDEMSSFAAYAFNKSHAAAYALLSYQTAYLKCHYPNEYMAALLTSVLDNTDKIIYYIAETKKMGIEVLPPDINNSGIGFLAVGKEIHFGLLAVKNLGRGFIKAVICEREKGKFLNLLDFIKRMQGKELNRRAIESLIKCGGLDCFGHQRSQMLLGYDKIITSAENDARNNISGQMDLFSQSNVADEYILPDAVPLTLMQMLTGEKETTGLYISGHPLSEYDALGVEIKTTPIRYLAAKNLDGKQVKILGIIGSKKLKTTKNNDMMAFMEIEDKTASIEVIVFPRVYEKYSYLIVEGAIIVISGRIKISDDDAPQIVCDDIIPPQLAKNAMAENTGNKNQYNRTPKATATEPQKKKEPSAKAGIYLKFAHNKSEKIETARKILNGFEGNTPVYYYYQDEKKYFKTPSTFWVASNDLLLQKLKNLLGEENVAELS